MMPEIPRIHESLSRSQDYTVTVNGHDVPVLDTSVGSVAGFTFDGPVEVLIRPARSVQRVVVRPLNRELTARPDDGAFRLQLDHPGNFSIEFDGDTERPLFLFAGPMRADRPNPVDPNVITLAAGQVHRFDELQLTSGQTLDFEPGAVLEAPIRATGADNIRILGAGIIDGRYRTDDKRDALKFVRCNNILIQDVHILDSYGWTLHLQLCEGVVLDNIRQTCWRANCDGVDINASRRVRVQDSFLYNTDDCVAIKVSEESFAMDKDARAEDIEVTGCVMWNGAGGNAMEIGFELNGASVSGVIFRDCDIIRVMKGACLSIHVGDAATISSILFEDIRVEDARDELIDFTIGLSIYSADCPEPYHRRHGFNVPPELQDHETNDNWLQWLVLPEPARSAHSAGRGHIEDVTVRDLQVHGSDIPPSLFKGYDAEKAIRRVRIENLSLNGHQLRSLEEARFVLRHAYDIELTPHRPGP
jgi:hypothetical protein